MAETTEHSGRTALENLLNALKPAGVTVVQEPGRQGVFGAPDFKITHNGRILGYIETKPPGENLSKILRSPQLKRYLELTDNLVLTDYYRFIWLRRGKPIKDVRIGEPEDARAQPDRLAALAQLLSAFLSVTPERIGQPEVLAEHLARRARLLRDALGRVLKQQKDADSGGRLLALYNTFHDQISAEITPKLFADAFAQMLAYALFLARLNAPERRVVDLHNVTGFIPNTFRLIRELAEFLDELEKPEYAAIRWVIEEILSLINGIDLAAMHEALTFRGQRIRRGFRARDEEEARLFARDPYIYFYEDFLAAYDPRERERRGVYYTPPPVVHFIIRAIDDLLKGDFGLAEGLAAHERVTVLDFATGTGTFLLEVMARIFDNIGGAHAALADLMVRAHILKHLYGFEFLIAPYTIAHLKLSQYLQEQGHPLGEGERLGVYLTNTLEPVQPQQNLFLPALSEEVKNAQAVKEKPILVITGNPPYNIRSSSKGEWIARLLEDYKQVDGKPLGERNIQPLNDDYVKFIRFAQAKMDGVEAENANERMQGVERGIVGVITNHSWLDNPTFRGMRRSLMKSFHAIHVLDLHGNARKKETAPDGGKDENVFDIMQGVAITLFVKNPDLPEQRRGIFHADLWGRRIDKYKALARSRLKDIGWQKLAPVAPFYLFIPQDKSLWAEYEKGWPVTEIFAVFSTGIKTHRDHFVIAFDKEEIERRLKEIVDPNIPTEELARRYKLSDNRDWSLARARDGLQASGGRLENVRQCMYRPFDYRWCHYGKYLMDFPREEIMRHMLQENVGISIGRAGSVIGEEDWDIVLVTEDIVDFNLFRRGGNVLFPLYLYNNTGNRSENIGSNFRDWLDARLGEHVPAEEIMAYVYAVLHAPTYRQRYSEFLRIDFPRIPFPDNLDDFHALAALGQALMQAHLMRKVPDLGLAKYDYEGAERADHEVREVRYEAERQRLWINDTTFFAPVPQEVWSFHIGGYQVLAKYLKDRKGRQLSLNEVKQVTRITNVLAFTIAQMQKIDITYRRIFRVA